MNKMIVNLRDVDIKQTRLFKEYAAYKKDLKFETENRSFLQVYLPPEIKKHHQEINDAINKTPAENIRKKADELIIAQNNKESANELVDFMASKNAGNFSQFSSMWSPIAWQAREKKDERKVTIGGKVISGADLGFIIATSLQQIDASQDPLSEYYDWCERQQKIETDINTNGTTEEEVIARNAFIGFLDDRETEIKRIIHLYAGSAFNSNSRLQEVAQEKLKFLVFKLSELRRLRERTASTKAYADTKENTEEKASNTHHLSPYDAAALASIGALSMAEKHLRAKMEYLPDCDIGENFLRMRPESTNREEVNEKIRLAQEHHEQTIAMLTAMRHGMSKDEWLKSQENNDTHRLSNQIRASIHIPRGWEASRFNEYCNA